MLKCRTTCLCHDVPNSHNCQQNRLYFCFHAGHHEIFCFSFLRPFLIEPEHVHRNKHNKQPLILNWGSLVCLPCPTVLSQCLLVPTKLRHRKRSCTWQDSATVLHRSRARREERAREEEQDTDFGCMCIETRWKYRRKVQKTLRNLFGNLAWKLLVHTHTHMTYAHTHILSLMTDSRHNTPGRGNKSVLCPVFETAVTLSSAGCHTLWAPSRGPHAPSCSLRDQAKIRSSLFHFRVTRGQ